MVRGPLRLAQIAFACVCTTAFGLLVVPDVNMIPKGSIGSTVRPGHAAASPRSSSNVVASSRAAPAPIVTTHPSPSPHSATCDANYASVIAPTHFVCSAKYATSDGTERVLVVTATAPTVAQASHERSISGQLS